MPHACNKRDAVPHLTGMGLLPCRRLGSLTTISLDRAIVYLPSLLCIGHQLQTFKLWEALIHTGALPGIPSNVFAAGWGSLRHLSMHGVCMDAALGAVHLPALEELCVGNVKVDPEGASSPSCSPSSSSSSSSSSPSERIFVDTSAAGCPGCTAVQYAQALPVLPATGLLCKDFAKLQRLTLLAWPGPRNDRI